MLTHWVNVQGRCDKHPESVFTLRWEHNKAHVIRLKGDAQMGELGVTPMTTTSGLVYSTTC